MLRHSSRQPLGLTLVEFAVGIAIASVVGLVTAGLFKAGILTYQYTVLQNTALTAARQALLGEGRRRGMLWTLQEARSVGSLSASSLTVSPPQESQATYLVKGERLLKVQLGVENEQAKGVSSLQVSYYSLDGQGRIITSASEATASLITVAVSLKGWRPSQKAYSFYSGAVLRNHP